MKSHLFFSPAEIYSPRWLQAFPTARISTSAPVASHDDIVWLLLCDELSFIQIQSLSALGTKVIAMTSIENAQEARHALEMGASGYVHYLAAPEVLEQVANAIAAGGVWLGAELMRQLVLATATLRPAVTPLKTDLSILTSREKAVAELVAAGKSNKEVARDLDITERTVKAHLGAVFEKLQVRDRLQLVLVLPKQSSV